MVDILFPQGSFRRRVAKKIAYKLGRNSFSPYATWSYEREDKITLLAVENLPIKPLISIVVPAFNTPQSYLEPLIESIMGQFYANWELILVDASTDPESSRRIAECKLRDTRIRVEKTQNKGISENTNFGISKSSGEYLAFMDHDDTLSVDALYEVVKAINKNPSAGLLYSDEDKLSEDGKRFEAPHFKPDWSPDLLTHVNYMTHFVVVKKSLAEKVGGLDPETDGAQDYDFLLKITDLDPVIVHIPKILYHWRMARNSTAQDVSNKPYIKKAGERALANHYKRKGVKVEVEALKNKPGFYEITYLDTGKPTVIIPEFTNPVYYEKYVKILHGRGVLEGVKLVVAREIDGMDKIDVEVVKSDNQLDFLKEALKRSGETAVIVNDFIIPPSKNWSYKLAGKLSEKHIHSVAPLVTRADDSIEDCGIVNNGLETIRLFNGYKLGINTFFGDTDWSRNVDCLTGKVIAIRTDELQKELETLPPDIQLLLHEFSSRNGKRFNTVDGSVVVKHVRSYARGAGESSLFNPNLQQVGSDLHLYPGDQQLADALSAFESGGSL